MDNRQQFKDYLRSFSFLTEEDCNLFDKELRETDFVKGESFLAAGQVCRDLGFVCKGGFRVYYLAEGKEINTRFVLENEFVVDYDSFLQQKPSRYHIEALEDAELLSFDLGTLQGAYQKSHNWERFGRLIAEHAYLATTQRVESFLFLDAQERYAQMLAEHPEYLQRIPLYHLASYLGIERESLSRIRRHFRTEH